MPARGMGRRGGGHAQVKPEKLQACPPLTLDSRAGGREGAQKVIPKQQLSKPHESPALQVMAPVAQKLCVGRWLGWS